MLHLKWGGSGWLSRRRWGRQLGGEQCGACFCPLCWWGDGQHAGGSASKGALRRERSHDSHSARNGTPSWLSRGDYSVFSNTAVQENK